MYIYKVLFTCYKATVDWHPRNGGETVAYKYSVPSQAYNIFHFFIVLALGIIIIKKKILTAANGSEKCNSQMWGKIYLVKILFP